MIFALGACIAGLLALLCLPAISRRALRMAQTAVERQMPISVDEIVAQRDLLRAEFATERRRLEQAVERAEDVHARDMIEAGRRTADIGRLGEDLSRMTTAHATAETARVAAERLAHETVAENATLQKALYDSDGAETAHREKLAALTRTHADLVGDDMLKARTIASLETERDEIVAARDAGERDLMQAKLDLSILHARVETLAAQIDNHEQAGRAAATTEADLRLRIDEYERKAALGAAGAAADAKDFDTLRRAIVEIGHEVVRQAERESATGPQEYRSAALN